MREETLTFFPEDDRRSRSGFNRFRRFLNNYWLIPLIFCYLQLATQVFYPADSPLDRISKGNRAFFNGVPIAYKIITYDFPFALLGHLYELGVQGTYKTNFFQVPHKDIKAALGTPDVQTTFYNRLVSSRNHHDSEIGGLLSISYEGNTPKLYLHEIPSLNEVFLTRLREASASPKDFIELINSKSSKDLFHGVGILPEWVASTTKLIKTSHITEKSRQNTILNFIEMYEALSESRYILSPYQFKAGIGKIPFAQRFVGIFHFHNGLNEPPSPTDIQQSLRNRQIVFTFSESGWTLYDVEKQNLAKIDIKIDKPIQLQ